MWSKPGAFSRARRRGEARCVPCAIVPVMEYRAPETAADVLFPGLAALR